MKKTVVIGATTNPDRYAYRATVSLQRHGHPVVGVGLKEGDINGSPILKGEPDIDSVDTVTMYVGTRNQGPLYNYILSLKPKRIIFNPGTENDELERMASEKGIECVNGCTLVMLSVGMY
jgi:predicted CoA-binding protein